MILIISICKERLSELEFVKPIENVLKKSSHVRFLSKHYLAIANSDLDGAEKIIICGTAMSDTQYLENIGKFRWLKEFEKPVLGIGAGAHICAKTYDNDLIGKTKIGQFKVEVLSGNKLTSKNTFNSYFLCSRTFKIKNDLEAVAKSGDLECMFKHKSRNVYGCLFNPEVLNPDIITNFSHVK